MDKDNRFLHEWEEAIKYLSEKNESIKEFDYFINIAKDYANLYSNRSCEKKVVILGHNFPDEIIRALDIDFCYVRGGSFETTLFQNVNLPKDIDDEVRSILGILKSDSLNLNENDVILIPLCSDSMKKINMYVEDFAKVICYEVSSDKENKLLEKRYVDEVDRVTKELEKHFKKKLSLKKLKEQCEISKKAAKVFAELESLYKKKTIMLTPSAFLLIANSYFMCDNKMEWVIHLERLIKELSEYNKDNIKKYPEVLFFGSPIYGPDYKVLFVLEKMPLKVCKIIHPDIECIKIAKDIDIKLVSIKYLAMRYLEADVSTASINNKTLIDLVMDIVKNGEINGVISHILKGQIEYDYVYKNIEKLMIDYKIPLNRIESIYDHHDVEQIRLRAEAFSEILNKNI